MKSIKQTLSQLALVSLVSIGGCGYTTDRTGTPNPSGAWNSVSLTSQLIAFGSYIAVSATGQTAIAGTDLLLRPSVYLCDSAISNCKKADSGLGEDLTSISALQFDGTGTLFGGFNTIVNGVFGASSTTSVKRYAASTGSWTDFQSFGGVGLGFDIATAGILTSSSFSASITGVAARGAADLFNPNGTRIYGDSNFESSALSAITTDGRGRIYVAGQEYKTPSQLTVEQPYYKVWAWSHGNAASPFTKIDLPSNLLKISEMVTDGDGKIFIAGVDGQNIGRVWAYVNGGVSDTGLTANRINSLSYSPNGYLLAAGVDNESYEGQVWYFMPGSVTWTRMNIPNASKIVKIVTNPQSNVVYAIGVNRQGVPTAWYFK